MVALELVSDREAKTPAPLETTDIYRLGLERGVLFGLSRYAGLGNVIKVKPPLDIPLEQLDRALDVLDEVLSIVESTSASRA
jgi:4-aminobutyrate aminotransferase-like enzyme